MRGGVTNAFDLERRMQELHVGNEASPSHGDRIRASFPSDTLGSYRDESWHLSASGV